MSTARVSVNKLGEFLVTSNPIRRRGIIRDQKQVPESVVPLYRQATQPIAEFLNGGCADPTPILRAIGRLRGVTTGTEWALRDAKNTAEALEIFLESADAIPITGITYVRGQNSVPKLTNSGVLISVRPEFLLHFERRGEKCVGALKLHCVKDKKHALGEDGGEFVATLTHRWLLAHGPAGRRPLHTHCFSLDVFRESLVSAPRAFTQRMKSVDAACAEIALAWPTL
ncbi:MAG: hypothetical protein WED34_21225 [Planctomycetales bacterium]